MQEKKGKVEFIPIEGKCTYYHKDEKGVCKNCKGTMKYVDGYHMIYESNGQKYGFTVDTFGK